MDDTFVFCLALKFGSAACGVSMEMGGNAINFININDRSSRVRDRNVSVRLGRGKVEVSATTRAQTILI